MPRCTTSESIAEVNTQEPDSMQRHCDGSSPPKFSVPNLMESVTQAVRQAVSECFSELKAELAATQPKVVPGGLSSASQEALMDEIRENSSLVLEALHRAKHELMAAATASGAAARSEAAKNAHKVDLSPIVDEIRRQRSGYDFSSLLEAMQGVKSNIDMSVILDELRAGSQPVDLGPLLDAVRQSATRTEDKLTVLQQAVGGIRTSIDFSPVLTAIKKLQSEVRPPRPGPSDVEPQFSVVPSLSLAPRSSKKRNSVSSSDSSNGGGGGPGPVVHPRPSTGSGGSQQQPRLTLAESAAALARQVAVVSSKVNSEASDSESPLEIRPAPLKLEVAIVKARGLKHLNTFRADEFYVVCTVKHGGRSQKATTCQTKAVKGLDPKWDETCELEPWTEGEAVELAIYDKGMVPGCDKTEAKVEIASDQFFPNGFSGELPLPGAANAAVTVGITPVLAGVPSVAKVHQPALLSEQPHLAEGKAETKYAAFTFSE